MLLQPKICQTSRGCAHKPRTWLLQNNSQQQPAPSWLPFAPWAFVLLWSAGYGVAKLSLEYTTPLNLLALRFIFTALILGVAVMLMRIRLPGWQIIKINIIVATFIHVLHFGMVYGGLALGASAGVIALFAASQPILVELAASLFRCKPPHLVLMFGLVMGMAGAVWVIVARDEFEGQALLGALMGFGAVVGLSIGTAYERRHKPGGHPLGNYLVQYLYAAAVSVPLALLVEGVQIDPDPNLIMAVSYLVIGNAITGVFLLLTMVRHGALSKVTSVMFLVPGLGALIAWLVVGEAMPPAAWPGIMLAAAGVLLVLYGGRLTGQRSAKSSI